MGNRVGDRDGVSVSARPQPPSQATVGSNINPTANPMNGPSLYSPAMRAAGHGMVNQGGLNTGVGALGRAPVLPPSIQQQKQQQQQQQLQQKQQKQHQQVYQNQQPFYHQQPAAADSYSDGRQPPLSTLPLPQPLPQPLPLPLPESRRDKGVGLPVSSNPPPPPPPPPRGINNNNNNSNSNSNKAVSTGRVVHSHMNGPALSSAEEGSTPLEGGGGGGGLWGGSGGSIQSKAEKSLADKTRSVGKPTDSSSSMPPNHASVDGRATVQLLSVSTTAVSTVSSSSGISPLARTPASVPDPGLALTASVLSLY